MFSTKNVELKEINKIVGLYLLGEMRTHRSTDTVENETENALKYPMEMLKTFRHGSGLPDKRLSLKKRVHFDALS